MKQTFCSETNDEIIDDDNYYNIITQLNQSTGHCPVTTDFKGKQFFF